MSLLRSRRIRTGRCTFALEVNHIIRQLRRNHYLIIMFRELLPRNNVKRFSKFHKAAEEIKFTIATFLCNDPESDKVVDILVISLKTNLPFSSFTMVFKPKAKILFQNEPV